MRFTRAEVREAATLRQQRRGPESEPHTVVMPTTARLWLAHRHGGWFVMAAAEGVELALSGPHKSPANAAARMATMDGTIALRSPAGTYPCSRATPESPRNSTDPRWRLEERHRFEVVPLSGKAAR